MIKKECKEYKMELLTPLFMHGGDSKGEVELRAASIKGLLRHWWRKGQTETSPGELLKRENEIFGSTENRSKIKVVVKEVKLSEYLNTKQKEFYRKHEGIKYLWHNGPVDRTDYKNLKDGVFKLCLNTNDEDFYNEIEAALKRLVLLGGIGGKNRRGLGRLHYENIKYEELGDVLEGLNDYEYYEYQSENKKDFEKWEELLNFLGYIYMVFRVRMKHGDDGKGDKNDKELIKKQYLAGYIQPKEKNEFFAGEKNERYPAKIVPLLFKVGDGFRGGFLVENTDAREEAKKAIDSFKKYITNKTKREEYLNKVIESEKNSQRRFFLLPLYNGAKKVIENNPGSFIVFGGEK